MIPLAGLIKGLTENLALVLSLTCIYGLLWPALRRTGPVVYALFTGSVFGGMAVAGMLMRIEVMPGMAIDERGVMIALAGAFNGPGSALVAGIIACAFRLGLGGAGTAAGVGAILTATAIGAFVHRRWGDRVAEFGVGRFTLLGAALSASSLLWIGLSDRAFAWSLLGRLVIPVTTVSLLGSVLLGLLLSYLQMERRRLTRTEVSIEHSREAMLWVDPAGRVTDANAAATTLCGYALGELRGMHVGRLHDACSAERWPAFWRKAREERLLREEADLRAKDGSLIPIEISCALVDLEGKTYLFYRLRDISERRRAETETEALAAVGRELAGTLDFAEASNRVLATLLPFFHATRTFLFRTDPTSDSLVCVAAAGEGGTEPWVGRSVPVGAGVSGRAVTEGRMVWSPDLLADPRILLADWARPTIEREGYRSVIAAPVISQGETIGVLVVADVAGRIFTEHDQRLLSALADGAAIALRNADLFGEATLRRREAEGLARVARSLSESLHVTEIAERIVGSVPSLLDVRYVILRRLAADGSLVALAAAGPAAQFFERGHAQPAGMGVAGRAVAEGRPVWTRNVLDDPDITLGGDLRRRLAGAGIRATLAVPMTVKGKTIGALLIGDSAARDISPGEVTLLSAFADQAALALENARAHEEAERQRRQAEVLSEIARSMNASLDLDRILQRVVEGAKELCGADAASISLRDPATAEMAHRWWTEPQPKGYGKTRVVPGKGAGGQVLLTGLPFRTDNYLHDLRIDPAYADAIRTAGTVALLVVAIRIDRGIEGLLYVHNLSPRPFTDGDETVLLQLAEHAAAVIGNATLYAKARGRSRRLRTLSTLTGMIASAEVTAQAFRAIAAAASTLLGAKVTYVWIADPEARVLRPEGNFGVDPETERRLVDVPIIPFGKGIPGQIIESRAPVYLQEVQGDPRGLNRRFTSELGLHAYAGLPLVHGDRAVGVL
ncbi:MAG: GAF domain-containing protein, partial [Candidatus Rokubacteria bacterium]|nr:GAF domain-containing protein [Candidatus Rokubacteria bacterium]